MKPTHCHEPVGPSMSNHIFNGSDPAVKKYCGRTGQRVGVGKKWPPFSDPKFLAMDRCGFCIKSSLAGSYSRLQEPLQVIDQKPSRETLGAGWNKLQHVALTAEQKVHGVELDPIQLLLPGWN